MTDQLSPDILKSIAHAYKESKILLVATKLGVFDVLPASASEIAGKLCTDQRATEMLMNALVAMELLVKNKGVYNHTPETEAFLVKGKEGYIGYSVRHTDNNWRDGWSFLEDAVKTGKSAAVEKEVEDTTEDFIMTMHTNSLLKAGKIVKIMDGRLKGKRKLLDVGGGSGDYSIAFLKANPEMESAILDLGKTLEITRRVVDNSEVKERISFVEGDYLESDFGEDYDVVLLSNIYHINSEEQNRKLTEKAYDCLNAGGLIVVHDFFLNDEKTGPRAAAIFSLHMLVLTDEGSSYSETEYRNWLTSAGFGDIFVEEVAMGSFVMVGCKIN